MALEYDPEAPAEVREVEGPHEDLFGHGTACAAIIRAIAPECELYSVRVLGERLTGKGFVFAAGVRWAIEHGMQVLNLSLSTGARAHFGRFHEVVDDAYFRRTMLVSAIRTSAADPTRPSSPGCSRWQRRRGGPVRVQYNPNGPAEFGAPRDRPSTSPGSEVATIRATGNSFAAPQIAGLIALILSKHPGLTPFQVKTVLAACASNTRAN